MSFDDFVLCLSKPLKENKKVPSLETIWLHSKFLTGVNISSDINF